MKNFYSGVLDFLKNEDGVTAIEYGLLASLISLIIFAGASLLGKDLNCLFNHIAGCILNPTTTTCSSTVTCA